MIDQGNTARLGTVLNISSEQDEMERTAFVELRSDLHWHWPSRHRHRLRKGLSC